MSRFEREKIEEICLTYEKFTVMPLEIMSCLTGGIATKCRKHSHTCFLIATAIFNNENLFSCFSVSLSFSLYPFSCHFTLKCLCNNY